MTVFLAALSLLPAVFAPQPGWHSGHGRVRACPGVSATHRCAQVASWAATIRRRGSGWCIPHRMIDALPSDGIILQLNIDVEHPLVARNVPSWPPMIRRRDVVAGLEGVSPRYGVYQLFARVGRVEAHVWPSSAVHTRLQRSSRRRTPSFAR